MKFVKLLFFLLSLSLSFQPLSVEADQGAPEMMKTIRIDQKALYSDEDDAEKTYEYEPFFNEETKEYLLPADRFIEMSLGEASNPRERKILAKDLKKHLKALRKRDPTTKINVVYISSQDTVANNLAHQNSSKPLDLTTLSHSSKVFDASVEVKDFVDSVIHDTEFAQSENVSYGRYWLRKTKEHSKESFNKETLRDTGLRLMLVGSGVLLGQRTLVITDTIGWAPVLAYSFGVAGLASASFIYFLDPFYGFIDKMRTLAQKIQIDKAHPLRSAIDIVENQGRWGIAELLVVVALMGGSRALALDPGIAEAAAEAGHVYSKEVLLLFMQLFAVTAGGMFFQGTWENVITKYYRAKKKKNGKLSTLEKKQRNRMLISISVISVSLATVGVSQSATEYIDEIYVTLGSGGVLAVLYSYYKKKLLKLKEASFWRALLKNVREFEKQIAEKYDPLKPQHQEQLLKHLEDFFYKSGGLYSKVDLTEKATRDTIQENFRKLPDALSGACKTLFGKLSR